MGTIGYYGTLICFVKAEGEAGFRPMGALVLGELLPGGLLSVGLMS